MLTSTTILLKTVLFVDDESSLTSLYARILEDAGFTVVCAADADGALVKCQHRVDPIDLLITDVFLPRNPERTVGALHTPMLNGIELAQRIKAGRPGLKVIFISGREPRDMQSFGGIPPGMPFLQKPFTREELFSIIRDVLHVPI